MFLYVTTLKKWWKHLRFFPLLCRTVGRFKDMRGASSIRRRFNGTGFACISHSIFIKVHTFWKGHKIWKNLPIKIWHYSVAPNYKRKIFSENVRTLIYCKFDQKGGGRQGPPGSDGPDLGKNPLEQSLLLVSFSASLKLFPFEFCENIRSKWKREDLRCLFAGLSESGDRGEGGQETPPRFWHQ